MNYCQVITDIWGTKEETIQNWENTDNHQMEMYSKLTYLFEEDSIQKAGKTIRTDINCQ